MMPDTLDSLERILPDLRVGEIKAVLNGCGYSWPSPRPEKREELERALMELSPAFEQVLHVDAVKKRLDAIHPKRLEKNRKAEFMLLCHTVWSRAASIRDEANRERTKHLDRRWKTVCSPGGGCNVEEEFARKWNSGQIKGLPPFFPGDRCHVYRKRISRPEG